MENNQDQAAKTPPFQFLTSRADGEFLHNGPVQVGPVQTGVFIRNDYAAVTAGMLMGGVDLVLGKTPDVATLRLCAMALDVAWIFSTCDASGESTRWVDEALDRLHRVTELAATPAHGGTQ